MTRAIEKNNRAYVDGYDFSGYLSTFGQCGVAYDAPLIEAYSDAVKNALIGRGVMKCGPLNGFFAPAGAGATGLHELTDSGQGTRNVLVAIGGLAAPAAGSPFFAWQFEQSSYQVANGTGAVAASLALGNASYAGLKNYSLPWGLLLHANAAETAANTANNNVDNGASSVLGGIFVYHLLSSNGTVTLSVDDSANNSTWAALSGATSGSIDATTTPASGMVALSTSATVRRYLRWQLALGTATTATFISGFIRPIAS